jgi:site-specific DNA-methyltransferase (adenine-specific)
MLPINSVVCGDNLTVMKTFEDNSIDAIVTDPPYALTTTARWKDTSKFAENQSDVGKRFSKGFMGKEWDGELPGIKTWEECLRVAKPGAHLAAFGGTRTFHRLAVTIEDAGWEVRDCINYMHDGNEQKLAFIESLNEEQYQAYMDIFHPNDTLFWTYGCLSEDTEILTHNGWERYHITTTFINDHSQILIYDIQKDIFKWETPKRWSVYNIQQDTCYRIRSDYTDQLISRNHRCLVEREGKLTFVEAEQLSDMENVPTLSNDIFKLCDTKPKILFTTMQWLLSRSGIQIVGKIWKFICRPLEKKGIYIVGIKKSGVERWSNIFQNTRQLCWSKICEMPTRIYSNGSERWLCNGTQTNFSTVDGEMFIESRGGASYRSRPYQQCDIKSDVIHKQPRTQTTRRYRITQAKITKEQYNGVIYCPTVSTGAFVARRNGKIFITGNSGFPKSTDVSKALDRKMNIEREDKFEGLGRNIGPSGNKKCEVCGKWLVSGTPCQCPRPQDEPISDIAKLFKGHGSALKPAWEPIILCRKPLDDTIANNVIKWGCGSLNIDACRVPTTAEEHQKLNDGRQSNRTIRAGEVAKGYGMKPEGLKATTQSVLGRFPANLILEDSAEVIGMFPNTKSGFMEKGTRRMNSESPNVNCYGKYKPDFVENSTYGDSGSAARFFYSSKVSRNERNAGLDDLPYKTAGEVTGGRKEGSAGLDSPRAGAGRTCGSKNTHPCLKPIKLMDFLIRLVSPPGGIVLDPFAGSGSTCIAAMQEGFKYIGIEKEAEYVEIANKRIAYWSKVCGK